MCEQLTTWKCCPTCKQRRSKIVRNINCKKVTIWKFGQCGDGVTLREEEFPDECPPCKIKREEEVEEERKRRFQDAWDEPTEYEDPTAMDQSSVVDQSENGDGDGDEMDEKK